MNPQIRALIEQGILKTGPLRPRSTADAAYIRATIAASRRAA
jgi:hypothetical protein